MGIGNRERPIDDWPGDRTSEIEGSIVSSSGRLHSTVTRDIVVEREAGDQPFSRPTGDRDRRTAQGRLSAKSSGPQMDMSGDPFGVLAAHPMSPLVTLHHTDYLDPIFPNMTNRDAIRHLHTCVDGERRFSVAIVNWGGWNSL
ncbi:hypothetical protein E3N88_07666 [Mikania micrantha]|uniref:Uncharacterized protein n=1 Tax=Mikania micrantha TaxID=192012 RepID=A0A5N6PG10_9ASTR|nr:hypothetical protein E3N88_07666 [Mikania micrantha]